MASKRLKLTWEDPPEQSRREGSINHGDVARELRAKPGVWARVAAYGGSSSSASMAQTIRTGRMRVYAPAGAFEAKARLVDGAYWVFARYVGEEKENVGSAPDAPDGA